MAVKLTRQTCGVVILAGGQSRRMGRCKALLEINGESLLSHLCAQLSDFEERWISVNDPVLGKGLPFRPVADIYQNAGPMGGLHAALRSSQKAALLCVCPVICRECHPSWQLYCSIGFRWGWMP